MFGPKVVAMRQHCQDEALERHLLTEDMNACSLSEDIPIHLPDAIKLESSALPNGLLAWRFAMRHVGIDPTRSIAALAPRGNKMALPLLSLMDDPVLCDAVAIRLASAAAQAAARRAFLPHVAMMGLLDRLFRQVPHARSQ